MQKDAVDFIVETAFGAVGFAMAGGHVARVVLMSPALFTAYASKTTHLASPSGEVQATLEAYLKNPHQALTLPVQEGGGTPFQRRVWSEIRAIPVGETRTYGILAQRLSSSPRAVANACGANPLPLWTPCHRVVAQNGLGGFMQGQQSDALAIKTWLLRHEGGSVF